MLSSLAITLLVLTLTKCESYAVWMIDSEFSCSREMTAGDVIMNHLVIPYTDTKYKFHFEIFRKSAGDWRKVELGKNEDDSFVTTKYLPGEEVLVRLGLSEEFLEVKAADDVQFVFEVDTLSSDALFITGNIGCNGKRVSGYGTGDSSDIMLKFAGGADIVTLSAGWATGKEAVKLVQPVHFIKLGVKLDDARSTIIAKMSMNREDKSHDDEL